MKEPADMRIKDNQGSYVPPSNAIPPPPASPGATITPDFLRLIRPKSHPRYSKNLHAWLSQRCNAPFLDRIRVYRHADGYLWVGFLDDGWFVGCQLMHVLCFGRGSDRSAYGGEVAKNVTEVAGFWDRYLTIGRCEIDQAHNLCFLDDQSRWLSYGESRHCLWCGRHDQQLRKWIEPVEREEWEPIRVSQPPSGAIPDTLQQGATS